MKKQLICALAAVTIAASGAYACTGYARDNDIKVVYDGEKLNFATAPQLINDTTMLPMRAVFEQFGASVKWDGATKTVTAKRKSKTITMTIGDETAYKNEEAVSMTCAPTIVNGSTLVPVRTVSELLGLEVDWNEKTRTVTITTPETEEDEAWKSNTGVIDLDSMSVSGEGVAVEGNTVTVTKGGDFTVKGELKEGRIVVNAVNADGEKEKVKLRLSGARIASSNGAPIEVQAADKLYITLEDGTENVLIDTTAADAETDAALYSKDDVELKGKGKLTLSSANGHGIKSSDSIEIANGKIAVSAAKDGINVNETVLVSGGELAVKAEGDGIQADEILHVTGGKLEVETTGAETSDTASSKGLKADWLMQIDGGEIGINSSGHGVHCADELYLNGGAVTVSSANKGISAHGNLYLNGTAVTVEKATEGIESKAVMTVNDGDIKVSCSDDGLNAGGTNGQDVGGKMGFGGGRGNRPAEMTGEKGEFDAASSATQTPERGEKPVMQAPPMQEQTAVTEQSANSEHHIQINGGNLVINAGGDGIDSNGTLIMDGGNVVVFGPSDGANGALDYGSGCWVNGGTLIATDAGAMLESPMSNSGQYTISAFTSAQMSAGTTIAIKDKSGKTLLSAEVPKSYSHVYFSTGELEAGESYTLCENGTDGESVELTDESKLASIGTRTAGSFGGGRFDKNQGGEMPTPPEMPNGNSGEMQTAPERPNGENGNMQVPPERPDKGMKGERPNKGGMGERPQPQQNQQAPTK